MARGSLQSMVGRMSIISFEYEGDEAYYCCHLMNQYTQMHLFMVECKGRSQQDAAKVEDGGEQGGTQMH